MTTNYNGYTDEEIQLDVEAARKLLARHGMVARIVGPNDVRGRLAKLNTQIGGYRCTNSAAAVKHAIEGDDWQLLEDETVEDDSKIWAIIDGTAHDHPEWFVEG